MEQYMYCVHGCYTVLYDEGRWYPVRWEGGAWRAYFTVTQHSELIVLRFTTYEEALDFVYQQP